MNKIERLITEAGNHKLKSWRVVNFTQYEDETFEFSEGGILVFKGLNSNGKSNALRALRLAMTCENVTKQRNFIRWGETDCSVQLFFTDGVEIEFIMTLSSTKAKAKFKNGYNMYLHHDGIREELFTTAIDGKYVTLREVPDEIKRYLNLATVDEGTINVMKGADGLILFRQSPYSIRKMLSSITQMESVDKAILRIKTDNKASLAKLQALDVRFQSYTEDIQSRRHLTPEVMNILRESDSGVSKLEEIVSLGDSVIGSLSRLENYDGISYEVPHISSVGLSGLSSVYSILDKLSSVESLPVIEGISMSEIKLLEDIKKALSNLEGLSEAPVNIDLLDGTRVKNLSIIQNILGDLSDDTYIYTTSVTLCNESVLRLLHNGISIVDRYKDGLSQLQHIESSLEKARNTLEMVTKSLGDQGHPLHKCSHCGKFEILGVHTHG